MRDYEDLVKRLRFCADLHGECALCLYQGNPCGCMPETPIIDAADAIEKLSSYAKLYEDLADKGQKTARELLDAYPKWISVEALLPQENKSYLIYGVFLPLGAKATDLCRFDGKRWLIDQNVKVTHWMPLPEPPKEV